MISSPTLTKNSLKILFSLFLRHLLSQKHIGSAHVSGTGPQDKHTVDKMRGLASVLMEYSFYRSQLVSAKQPAPGSSDGKESACDAGDLGSIPGSQQLTHTQLSNSHTHTHTHTHTQSRHTACTTEDTLCYEAQVQGAVRGETGSRRGHARLRPQKPSLSRGNKTRDLKNQKKSVMHKAKSRIPVQRTGQDFLHRNNTPWWNPERLRLQHNQQEGTRRGWRDKQEGNEAGPCKSLRGSRTLFQV